MRYLLLGSLFLLSACSTTGPSQSPEALTNVMTLIEQSEAAAPYGVAGNFTLKIKSVGQQGGVVYLNTQEDYRDRRNITVRLSAEFATQIVNNSSDSLAEFFVGKVIRVAGEAKREHIDFTSRGRATGKYYYQTHIAVEDSAKILVAF